MSSEDKAILAFGLSIVAASFVVIMSAMSCDRQREANAARVECVKAGKPVDDCARMIQP